MMRRSALLALGFLVGASVVVGRAAPATTAHAAIRYLDPTFTAVVRRDVAYGTAIGLDGKPTTLRLDLYTPQGDLATDRPVFVFAHGGGFTSGDKNAGDAPGWAIALAQRGYVTASINYRMGPHAVVAPVDTVEERQQIEIARADMQTAVRWFRSQAVQLGIDPDRIAVGGSSAGAITALGVAVHADDPAAGDLAGYSSAVCTAVSMYGANEPSAIGPDDAGAIFHHGTVDGIVPYELGVATYDAMVAKGLPSAFYSYPGENHGLTPASQELAMARSIEWLYQRVATAASPCSPAVAAQSGVPGGTQTPVTGLANRSAVVSIVAVDTRVPGYVQVLPCGSVPGGSANLNTDDVGQTRAGLAVGRFDAAGRLCIFNQSRTHLVVDLQGWFAPGALDDVPDLRVLDTRTGSAGPVPAGSQTPFSGRPGATAIVSLVAVDNAAPGYVQVVPCGSTPGGSANLNADAAGEIRSGLALVRFDGAGRACLYAQMSTHLVVDLQAYLAASSVDDVPDARLLDTRDGARPTDGSQTVFSGRPGATAAVSIVATESTGPGYLQVLPCGTLPGAAANLNVDRVGETIGGLAFIRFGDDGHACVFVQTSTHVVIDLQGYLAAGAFEDVPDVRLLDSRVR